MNKIKISRKSLSVTAILASILILLFTLVGFNLAKPQVVEADSDYFPFLEGYGNSSSPYLISTPEDLQKLAENSIIRKDVNGGKEIIYTTVGKYFKLKNDIDYSSVTENFKGINYFGGSFDGAGFTIKNIKYSQTSYHMGLFNEIKQQKNSTFMPVIKNLKIQNVKAENKNDTFKQSFIESRDPITNEDINPPITRKLELNVKSVGGLVGLLENGLIENCVVDNSETFEENILQANIPIGGLVGSVHNTSENGETIPFITNSYVNTKIVSTHQTNYVGGLVGSVDGNFKITNSYSIAEINIDSEYYANAAGLIGGLNNPKSVSISQVYWYNENSPNLKYGIYGNSTSYDANVNAVYYYKTSDDMLPCFEYETNENIEKNCTAVQDFTAPYVFSKLDFDGVWYILVNEHGDSQRPELIKKVDGSIDANLKRFSIQFKDNAYDATEDKDLVGRNFIDKRRIAEDGNMTLESIYTDITKPFKLKAQVKKGANITNITIDYVNAENNEITKSVDLSNYTEPIIATTETDGSKITISRVINDQTKYFEYEILVDQPLVKGIEGITYLSERNTYIYVLDDGDTFQDENGQNCNLLFFDVSENAPVGDNKAQKTTNQQTVKYNVDYSCIYSVYPKKATVFVFDQTISDYVARAEYVIQEGNSKLTAFDLTLDPILKNNKGEYILMPNDKVLVSVVYGLGYDSSQIKFEVDSSLELKNATLDNYFGEFKYYLETPGSAPVSKTIDFSVSSTVFIDDNVKANSKIKFMFNSKDINLNRVLYFEVTNESDSEAPIQYFYPQLDQTGVIKYEMPLISLLSLGRKSVEKITVRPVTVYAYKMKLQATVADITIRDYSLLITDVKKLKNKEEGYTTIKAGETKDIYIIRELTFDTDKNKAALNALTDAKHYSFTSDRVDYIFSPTGNDDEQVSELVKDTKDPLGTAYMLPKDLLRGSSNVNAKIIVKYIPEKYHFEFDNKVNHFNAVKLDNDPKIYEYSYNKEMLTKKITFSIGSEYSCEKALVNGVEKTVIKEPSGWSSIEIDNLTENKTISLVILKINNVYIQNNSQDPGIIKIVSSSNPVIGNNQYLEGTKLTIEITPREGFNVYLKDGDHCMDILGDDNITYNDTNMFDKVVTATITIKKTLELNTAGKKKTCIVTFSFQPDVVTIMNNNNNNFVKVNYNEPKTVSIAVAQGYKIGKWYTDNGDVYNNEENLTTITITTKEDIILVPEIIEIKPVIKYNIPFNIIGKDNIDDLIVRNCSESFNIQQGTEIKGVSSDNKLTITIMPKVGYYVKAWKIDNEEYMQNVDKISIDVNKQITIQVEVAEKEYEIKLTTNAYEGINFTPKVKVKHYQSFTIADVIKLKIKDNYKFNRWVILDRYYSDRYDEKTSAAKYAKDIEKQNYINIYLETKYTAEVNNPILVKFKSANNNVSVESGVVVDTELLKDTNEVKLALYAAEGYSFKEWIYPSGKKEDKSIIIVPNEDKEYKYVVEQNRYNVKVVANIESAGEVKETIQGGLEGFINVKAKKGYKIETLSINGVNYAYASNKKEFQAKLSDVTQDVVVKINYKEDGLLTPSRIPIVIVVVVLLVGTIVGVSVFKKVKRKKVN